MPGASRSRSLATVAIATVAITLFLFSYPSPLAGSAPLQSIPEITEKECAFWLDHDGDGKGDQRLAGEYIPQETPVIGGCDFKLSVPEAATITVESELKDWEAEVEVRREPGSVEDFQIYPGRPEITGVAGSMRVIVNFAKGDTPRSGRERTLRDEYRHEVQIPDHFRILGVTVTAPDGRKDRLEENAQSASDEYINVHRSILEREGELPEWAVTLAREWLEAGYPQVSESIIAQSADSTAGTAGWWMWAAIVTWIVISVSIIAGAVFIIRAGKRDASELRRPGAPF